MAAEQGSPNAQYRLGSCYFTGKGVQQNYAEAVKWMSKAAHQGDALAQNGLGVCYREGKGVPADIREAYKWYQLAADQGDEAAKKDAASLATLIQYNDRATPMTIDRAAAIVDHVGDEFASGRRIEDAFIPFAAAGASTRLEARFALYIAVSDCFRLTCLRGSRSTDAMEEFTKYADAAGYMSLRISCDHLKKGAGSSKRFSELLRASELGNMETVSSFVDHLRTLNPESSDYWPKVYGRIGLDYPGEPVCHPKEKTAFTARKPWWRFW